MKKINDHTKSSHLVAIIGPTGVGKTDFSYQVSALQDSSIINGDVGQLYRPLSIGTAKPPLPHQTIPHFLFDEITIPESFSSVRYRDLCRSKIDLSRQEKRMPIVVGGSLFYVESLFFLRDQAPLAPMNQLCNPQDYTWELLYSIDPERAALIHPNDQYRVHRALTLWARTGKQPSKSKEVYDPLVEQSTIFFLTRDRDDLYVRINRRVQQMLEDGWIDEVAGLPGEWRSFIREKKIIGYNEIDAFLQGYGSYESMVQEIAQRTRHYAKRQLTYWKRLKKKLEEKPGVSVHEINLTLSSIHLYLDFVPLTQ